MTGNGPTGDSTGNLIIDSLPAEALRALDAEVYRYDAGEVVLAGGKIPGFVFFPHADALCSIVRVSGEGTMVEAALVGSEGVAGIDAIITDAAPMRSEVIVQIDGDLTRVPVAAAREHFLGDAAFRDVILAYTSAYLDQLAQNTVCNRLHSIEQRLAKWLLNVRDRHSRDELRLTHEFLGHMLGIHRPGVSLAVNTLELDGIIAHTRNRISIRDREGLLLRSCECHDISHESLSRLRAAVRRA